MSPDAAGVIDARSRPNPLARFTDTAENRAGFQAQREGGFATLAPLTPGAGAWLRANVDDEASWAGPTLVMERRYFSPPADATIAAGLTFERDPLPN